ncbi:MAG: hypothetical protein F6J97_16935 [Leptolyngbya sp. SIO4C1]|nr:hypothetical protein [Leptolyngbya sp. SIO4C1]
MLKDWPPIAFYLPTALWPKDLPLPEDSAATAHWRGFGLGIYAWTVQTALRLQRLGVPCQLTAALPEDGLVFFHSNAARVSPVPATATRLPICLKAESTPLATAPVHIVQNPGEVGAHHYFIPHWPQPGLLPRDRSRADRFETVAFFGHSNSLAPELQTEHWQRQLAQLGLAWQPAISHNRWSEAAALHDRWHDYRQVDAVIAVRSFDRQRYPSKPATKLYNAWLAEVPAVLGVESAYRATGHSGVDYLEVASFDALIKALRQLKHSAQLRRTLVANGRRQVQRYQPEQIEQRWCQFIESVALPIYERWRTDPVWRHRQQIRARWHSYQTRACRRLSSHA